MGETAKSIRLYCALVGVMGVYTGVFGGGVFLGLRDVVTGGWESIPWFAVLRVVSPLLQLGAGLLLLYIAWRLPALLSCNVRIVRSLFTALAALILAHGLVDAAQGLLLSLAASAFALLVISYLYNNVKRLALTSATG